MRGLPQQHADAEAGRGADGDALHPRGEARAEQGRRAAAAGGAREAVERGSERDGVPGQLQQGAGPADRRGEGACQEFVLCLLEANTPVHILEQVVLHGVHHVRAAAAQLEDLLHHRDLRGRRVHAAERRPVVRHHAGADHVRAAVHRARHQRHLQQRGQLLLLLHRRVRVHQTALVREHAVASHQRVAGDRLPEHLHAQHVRHDLLRLLTLTPLATTHAVQIGVQQSHVVVAGNQVSQRGQSFVHALHHHLVGQGVADVLQLGV